MGRAAAWAMGWVAMLAGVGLLDPAVHAGGVPAGHNVILHFEYSGTVMGSLTGKQVFPCSGGGSSEETVSHTSSWTFRWTSTMELRPGTDGRLHGSGIGTISGQAERSDLRTSESWGAVKGSSGCPEKLRSERGETECRVAFTDRTYLISAAVRAVDERLHVEASIGKAPVTPQEWNCEWTSVTWRPEEGEKTTRGETIGPATLVTHAFLAPGAEDPKEAEFTLPLEGREALTPSFTGPLPVLFGDPAFWYCGMPDTRDWTSGTCSARGSMKVHVTLDPCPGLVQRYRDFLAAVKEIQPPPPEAPEAWVVKAWKPDAHAKTSALLGAARQLLLQCGEKSLPEDPGPAIDRVLEMYRTALRALHARNPTERVAHELLATERQLALLGSAETEQWIDLPSPGPGTLEVSVHSPVALHAYDPRGRHVGWNFSSNRSEVQIPGASFEGAPRSAQRIVLPAGFYQIVVDELAAGKYFLDIFPNATGAGAGEAFLATSQPGRSTSVHYALDFADGNATLHGYFPRRAATRPASFLDSGFAVADPAASKETTPPGGGPVIPGFEAAGALAAAAAALATSRRRRQGEA